jgi:hypothetical protein
MLLIIFVVPIGIFFLICSVATSILGELSYKIKNKNLQLSSIEQKYEELN